MNFKLLQTFCIPSKFVNLLFYSSIISKNNSCGIVFNVVNEFPLSCKFVMFCNTYIDVKFTKKLLETFNIVTVLENSYNCSNNVSCVKFCDSTLTCDGS